MSSTAADHENDALAQQAREDVERALAARGLLDHDRHQIIVIIVDGIAHGSRFRQENRFDASRANIGARPAREKGADGPISRRLADRISAADLDVLVGLQQLGRADLAVLDLGEREDMVDDLLLVDRRAQLGERLLIVAVEVPDLLFLAREGARAGDQRLGHLLVGDLDVRLGADLGQQRGRAARGARRCARYSARAASSVVPSSAKLRPVAFCSRFDLRPDLVEFLVDEPLRHFELVARRPARRAACA